MGKDVFNHKRFSGHVIFCLSRFRLSVVFESVIDEMPLGIPSKDKRKFPPKRQKSIFIVLT